VYKKLIIFYNYLFTIYTIMNFDILATSGLISRIKKTGNPILDGIILSGTVATFSYFMKKKHKIYDSLNNLIEYLKGNEFKYSIKLLSYETSNTQWRPKIQSSEAYNAIISYIKQNNFKMRKNDGIYEISENYHSFNGRLGRKYNEFDEEEIQDKMGYDITQKDKFYITDGIYGKFDYSVREDKEDNGSINNIKNKYLVLMSNISLEYIEIFIEKCIKLFDEYKEMKTSKGPFIFTYKNIKKTGECVFEEKYFRTRQTLDNSIFDTKEDIIKAINKFQDKKYYLKHPSLTRKLVFLFHGEPGTGKTFSIRLIANKLNRNIIIIPLNKIKSLEELNSVLFFTRINDHNITPDKCVFVIEDLDAMTNLLKSRKKELSFNKTSNNKVITNLVTNLLNSPDKKDKKNDFTLMPDTNYSTLTMSDVLNTLDGIYKLDNFVIAFSTNHIEQLDKAFLRDQRITHNIEFKKCSKNTLKKIIEKWFESKIPEKYLSRLVDNKLTLANITTICDKCDNIEEVFSHI
jgi:hypothetical protein